MRQAHVLLPQILKSYTRTTTTSVPTALTRTPQARPFTTRKMSHPIPLSEIPTLSLLYKLNRIPPPSTSTGDPDAADLPEPNETYNDKISIIRQDITVLAVDAIVNAANNSLLGGGGVDGAIHRAAGPSLLAECETLDGCETGSAKITDGYELPAQKVIHAVGPVYWITKPKRTHAHLLGSCYRRSLEIAVENGLSSVAFPALSTGVYGYPSFEASEVALGTVREFFEEGKGDDLERVVFCNFLQKDEDAYHRNVGKYFPPATAETETKIKTEKIEGEGDVQKEKSTDPTDLDAKLPDAPTTEPKDDPEQPDAKKLKAELSEDDFVVVDKEEVKGATEAGVVPPKADL